MSLQVRQAVVLAAGLNRRMGGTNKLAQNVGQYPLIQTLLSRIAESGISKVLVVCRPDAEDTIELVKSMRSYFSEFDLAFDPCSKGTLETLQYAKSALSPRPFLLVEGSILVSIPTIRDHRQGLEKGEVALLGVTADLLEAPTHSLAVVSSGGYLEELRKYSAPKDIAYGQKLARSLGIWCLDDTIFRYSPRLQNIWCALAHIQDGSEHAKIRVIWDDGSYRHFAVPADFDTL